MRLICEIEHVQKLSSYFSRNQNISQVIAHERLLKTDKKAPMYSPLSKYVLSLINKIVNIYFSVSHFPFIQCPIHCSHRCLPPNLSHQEMHLYVTEQEMKSTTSNYYQRAAEPIRKSMFQLPIFLSFTNQRRKIQCILVLCSQERYGHTSRTLTYYRPTATNPFS